MRNAPTAPPPPPPTPYTHTQHPPTPPPDSTHPARPCRPPMPPCAHRAGVDLAEHLPRDGVTPLKSKMMGAVMRHRGSGSGASSRACGASETTATYA